MLTCTRHALGRLRSGRGLIPAATSCVGARGNDTDAGAGVWAQLARSQAMRNYSRRTHDPLSVESRWLANTADCFPDDADLEPDTASKAHAAFEQAWAELEHSGVPLIFPREIIWLNGAPGSGKSHNSKFIMKTRGFAHEPIVMSELLQQLHPEDTSLMAQGKLLDDEKVVGALLRELVKPEHHLGALVDGFPRTSEQVAMLPLLCDKMSALCKAGYPNAPNPRFFICILTVCREVSAKRQKDRGEKARMHNHRQRYIGGSDFVEERETDFDDALINRRYDIFEEHSGALRTLHGLFHFKDINANCDEKTVQEEMRNEFKYQSEHELDKRTFESIDEIPKAETLKNYARSALTQRLNDFKVRNVEEFDEAVDFVRARVIPACRNAAFSGVAQVKLEPGDSFHKRFQSRTIRKIVMDILTERGYRVCYFTSQRLIPTRVKEDNTIEVVREIAHGLNVRFSPANLRD